MIEDRKAELRREIQRREHELAKLDALPNFEELVDGTVAALMVTLGRSRPYTFIAFKTRGRWYLTGQGSPNAVSSDELAEWLVTGGRRLETWAVVAEIDTVTVGVAVDLSSLLDAAAWQSAPRRQYPRVCAGGCSEGCVHTTGYVTGQGNGAGWND